LSTADPLPEGALVGQRLLAGRAGDDLVELGPQRIGDEVPHHDLDAEEGL